MLTRALAKGLGLRRLELAVCHLRGAYGSIWDDIRRWSEKGAIFEAFENCFEVISS